MCAIKLNYLPLFLYVYIKENKKFIIIIVIKHDAMMCGIHIIIMLYIKKKEKRGNCHKDFQFFYSLKIWFSLTHHQCY